MPSVSTPAAGRLASEAAEWMDVLPEAVLVSRAGKVAYANRAARRLFGAGPGQGLPGRPLAALIEAAAGGAKGPARATRLDGSRFPAAVSAEPVALGGEPAILHLVRSVEHEQALQLRLERKRSALLALSGRLIRLQEQERRHIARELHDEIGQCLSAIRVQFAKLQRRVESPEALALIASAAGMTEDTLGRVRSLSLLLHPPQLDTLGLAAALRWHLEEQQRLHGLKIELTDERSQQPVHADLAIAIYRIVQESVSNVLRHAGASTVAVSLRVEGDSLALEIRDDGRGFDAETQAARMDAEPTLGLLSMRERARLFGGELSVTSSPGRGTRIAAHFPINMCSADDATEGGTGR